MKVLFKMRVIRLQKRSVNNFLSIIALFLLVYDVKVSNSISFLTTERIGLLLLLIIAMINSRRRLLNNSIFLVNKSFNKLLGFYALLMVYSVVLILTLGKGNGSELYSEFLKFFVVVPLAFWTMKYVFSDIDSFFNALLVVSMVQALIVLLCLLFPSFATIIDPVFNSTSYYNYPHMRSYGYAAGIVCISSTGALQLSIGLIPCIYFIIKGRKTLFYACCFMIISVASIAVARTGIVTTMIGCIMMLIIAFYRKNKRAVAFIGTLTVLLFGFILIATIFEWGDNLAETFKRLLDLKEKGLYDSFFSGYYRILQNDNGIPPISIKTIIGTGITSGVSGNGICVTADGGYVRMYVGIGLPLAILFYLFTFIEIFKLIKRIPDLSVKISLFYFFFVLVLGEYKEPFIIFKRYMFLLTFVSLYFAYRDYSLKMDCLPYSRVEMSKESK